MSLTLRYRVVGMDCLTCATNIEAEARKTPGVKAVKVSIASQVMTLTADDEAPLGEVERAVTGLGYRLRRLDAPHARPEAASDGWAPTPARSLRFSSRSTRTGIRRRRWRNTSRRSIRGSSA